MVTLIYHIHPWMKKSIVEAEDQIKKESGSADGAEHFVGPPLHRCIWAASARTPIPHYWFYYSSRGCEDIDNILEMRGPEPKIAPFEIAEDIVLTSLFTSPTTPPKPYECAKRHRYSCTADGNDDRARRKERMDL